MKFSGALQKKNSKEDSTAGLFWCGMLGILLSLGSFPWDLLRQNAVFQVLTFSMQSPTIFMIPAICGLTFIVCGLLNTYREEKSATEATILETAVLAVAFVSTQFLTNKLLLGRAPLWDPPEGRSAGCGSDRSTAVSDECRSRCSTTGSSGAQRSWHSGDRYILYTHTEEKSGPESTKGGSVGNGYVEEI